MKYKDQLNFLYNMGFRIVPKSGVCYQSAVWVNTNNNYIIEIEIQKEKVLYKNFHEYKREYYQTLSQIFKIYYKEEYRKYKIKFLDIETDVES